MGFGGFGGGGGPAKKEEETKEDVDLVQNKNIHYELALEYYLNTDIPLFGLILYKNSLSEIEDS